MTSSFEKQRRMTLRQRIGNRVIAGPLVRTKGPEYLIPCACFTCRKSFKKPVHTLPSTCPECAGELFEMGRNFSAPKTANKQQWLKVERLWKAGFRFIGSGSYDAPKLPKTLQDVEDFISQNPDHPLKTAESI